MKHEACDRYIIARACLPQGDEMWHGMVVKRKRGRDGELLGHFCAKPSAGHLCL